MDTGNLEDFRGKFCRKYIKNRGGIKSNHSAPEVILVLQTS